MLTKSQVKNIQQVVGDSDARLPLVFNALSDLGRFKIFKLFMRQHGLCVTDVANVLDISVPAASQQLKIMEMSGLVQKQREGQMICYSIKRDDSLVRSMMRMVAADDN